MQLKCWKTLCFMIEGHYNMDFNPSKTPVEVLKEGSLEVCFQNMYSNVTDRWHNDSWKEFLI